MVMSVFAMTMAFSGSVAAVQHDRGSGGDTTTSNAWDTSTGSGNIGGGAIVFQGESAGDITFEASGSEVLGQSLTNNDQENLASIASDQPTTAYTGGGITIYVESPEISDYEFQTGSVGGADIAGSTVSGGQSDLYVWADYNYAEAEDLDIEVTDSNDLDVTGEALASGEPTTRGGLDNTQTSDDSEVAWHINLDNLDEGEQYTVALEGTDDLDSGDAAITDTFTVGTEDELSLSLSSDEVTKGESTTYDIEGGAEGDYHLVTIDRSDVTGTATEVFRNIEDTAEVGQTGTSSNGYAYALVEIDGGVGTGGIDTGELDDTDVTVDLYSDVLGSSPTVDQSFINSLTGQDDQTLTVNEGSVTLENPTQFYVPGSEVNVNGTASVGVSNVELYARDNNDYERVTIGSTSVSDGEFEWDDVDLGANSNILGLPGTYRIAVVDASEPASDADMTTTEMAQATSDTHTIRVTEAELEASASIINGQLADGDSLNIAGAAPGAVSSDADALFYGPRGNVAHSSLAVGSDGTFDEDVNPNGLADSPRQGTVVLTVTTPGRDGTYGTGSIGSLSSEASTVSGDDLTQQQAIERIAGVTTEDTGSDDKTTSFQFRFTDGRVNVDTATGEAGVNGQVAIGDEMTVAGTTNWQPEDNVVTVEVIDGPSAAEFPVETTDSWGTDGQWNVSINTTDLEPGNYTVEATSGAASDVMSFSLAEEVTTPTEETTEETTEQTTEETTEQTTEQTTEMTTEQTEETTEGQDGPGFGVALALIALVAAALLAVRRNN